MRALKIAAIAIAALLIAFGFVRAFSGLPSLDGRSRTMLLTDTVDTPLGRATGPRVAAHPGVSGVHELRTGHGAFAARVLLARAARRSLDLQYYIWHKDLAGTLLFQELRAAADRGVRVRLLLDDNVTAGLDPTLAALDRHSNIEVRLYNPFVMRNVRALGYVTDFVRLNRRMHNKSFTADNQATIVGGRNIGDEYMGVGDGLLFADLDVLAVGPVVADVSRQFDLYWNSRSAYPADHILPPVRSDEIDQLTADAARVARARKARRYVEAVRGSPIFAQLEGQSLPLIWAATRLIHDHPSKTLGRADPSQLLVTRLKATLGEPNRTLVLVSGYFVPTDGGVYAFKELAKAGVRVRILTNALEATDVPIVYAGYADKRKALLESGVALFEMRGPAGGNGPDRTITGSGGSASGSGTAIGGSATSLHAKTFSVDGSRTFIGSFNFDPRSARFNTELGVIIESPLLALRLDDAFDEVIPVNAYQVKLAANGDLYWLERRGDRVIRHDTEPGTTFLQRTAIGLLALLPIDWLL